MTNKNYFLLLAAGIFTIILALVMIKMIYDRDMTMPPAYKTFMDRTFIKYNIFEGQQKPFPDNVVFYDPKGQPVTIQNFRGQYLLINFWATWCPGCVKELPSLENLRNYVQRKDYPLTLIAVSLDREKDANELAAFLVDNKIGPFALYHDRDKAILRAYYMEGMPTTLLIDPEGYVLYEFLGEADWTDYFLIEFLRDEMGPFIEVLEKDKSSK